MPVYNIRMDQPHSSPENMPVSEMELLLYRLQSLFIEHNQYAPSPWFVRRYVDGRGENTFDIQHSPDTGSYRLDAEIENLWLESGHLAIHDTLSPMGRFLGDPMAEVADRDYNERRAKQFNELLARSTSKPYGRLGRLLVRVMRERYRWSI